MHTASDVETGPQQDQGNYEAVEMDVAQDEEEEKKTGKEQELSHAQFSIVCY